MNPISSWFLSIKMMFVDCRPIKDWLAAGFLVNRLKSLFHKSEE